jgi:hypothetical protein
MRALNAYMMDKAVISSQAVLQTVRFMLKKKLSENKGFE